MLIDIMTLKITHMCDCSEFSQANFVFKQKILVQVTVIYSFDYHLQWYRIMKRNIFGICKWALIECVALGPLLLTCVNFNPSMDKLWHQQKVWDVTMITYLFPNLNDAAAEVWEWINNFILHSTAFTAHVITYPCSSQVKYFIFPNSVTFTH